MVGTRKVATFILFGFIVNLCNAFHCMSPSGKPVDWFVVYKLPKITDNTNPLIKDGVGYFYLDESTAKSWVLSKNEINGTTQNPMYNTLLPIYKQQVTSSYMYMIYNDEPSDVSPSLTHGHCKDKCPLYRGVTAYTVKPVYTGHPRDKNCVLFKRVPIVYRYNSAHAHMYKFQDFGVVAFNTTTGFWLIHSVPKYPSTKGQGYIWPSNAYEYGQTFLCVTYNIDMLDVIGVVMQYIYPKIYDKMWPDEFVKKFPNMAAVMKDYRQKHITQAPFKKEILLKSKGLLNVHSFAKAADFGDDLYAGWLAPQIGDSLATETWRNGAGNLDSNCTQQYSVYNIQDIDFNMNDIMFKSTKDHSKWAVSKDKHGYWACIGDINRQRTQYKRGGGVVCLSNHDIWKPFKDIVRDYETCGLF